MMTFTLGRSCRTCSKVCNPSIPGISRSSNTKSGSEPPFSNASASSPVLAVSTANSSSSSKVLIYRSMPVSFLGSSTGIQRAGGRQRNQKTEFASVTRIALHPNLTAECAHEAPHYGQTKPRAVRFAALLWDAKKVVKHFQVKFRSDAGACIGHAYFDGIGRRQCSLSLPPVVRKIRGLRRAPVPNVRVSVQPHGAAGRREFAGVVQ